MRKPAEFKAFPSMLASGYGPYRAIVRNVVDGDTIDCLIDVGFNDYVYRVIRLAGIDAPEKNRAATAEAGHASSEFLRSLLPVGTPVALTTQPDPDSFGRYIAVVHAVDGDVYLVHERMISAGHAIARNRW